MQEVADAIKEKILHILSVYPKLSPSMLQMGLGAGCSASMWKPVLHGLIADGIAHQYFHASTFPSGKAANSPIISLSPPSD